ncbi:GDYXXLXY domain-containing protein, partial [Acinetobacter baumannii]|uniref:GDYXXLXY domain-containing protein n=1 Tax=Acinetobacter baumannii TaxID=470 RepID=UPI00300C6365
MKKHFSLMLSVVTVLFFAGLVMKNELQLHQSNSIFIKLKPVDTRSIIQGDYMALAY